MIISTVIPKVQALMRGYLIRKHMREAALAEGYRIMVGCMVGSSLAMAPAVLVAQGAMVTDLDGPLLLAQDRDTPLRYDDRGVHPPEPALWG